MASPELYGALAAAILQDTTVRWKRPVPEGHGHFTFAAASEMLVGLGVAEAVDTYGSDHDASVYRQYRLAIDDNKAAAVVVERASSGAFDMPPIDDMLAAWLACAYFFKLVSVTPEPFVPHDDVQAVMQELVQSGYATRHDGRMRWTDKIAPAMALYHGPDPELYGALAASLVRLAVGGWQHPEPQRTATPGEPEPLRVVVGSRFHWQALSAFGKACMLLFRLGLAHPVKEDGTIISDHSDRFLYAGSFAMAVDGSRIGKLVTERAASGLSELPPIGELMGVWLGCADHFGLSVRRQPFVPDNKFCDVMQELVRSGYAWTKRGRRFVWTDKIGLVMQSQCLWDVANHCFEEMHERQTDVELRDAARSVPDDVRRMAIEGDVLSVYMALCGRWIDGEWRPEPDDPVEGFGGIDRAGRFIEIVLESPKGTDAD
jgi:hypothetical protein